MTLNSSNLTLVLSGTDTLQAAAKRRGGTLEVTNSDAIPPGTGLTVGTGGTVVSASAGGRGAMVAHRRRGVRRQAGAAVRNRARWRSWAWQDS